MAGKLAVILGSNAVAPGGGEVVAAAKRHGAVALPRHGSGGEYLLPHRIDYVANLRRLRERGCDRVLAVCSVGSLREEIAVGSLVCPHDFIALQLTVTGREDPGAHAVAGFDPRWRGRLIEAWRRSTAGELRDGGVYWHANGPRFETPAEIALIAAHADLVGMTMAAECVLACELGLPYAAVCAVDNLANGIAARPLSPEQLERDRAANAARLAAALDAVLPELT